MLGESVEEYALLLQQAQLVGAGDGFGAALHLEFVEDPAVVPFDGVQGQEKPLADLPVREPWVISFRISSSRGSMARPSTD